MPGSPPEEGDRARVPGRPRAPGRTPPPRWAGRRPRTRRPRTAAPAWRPGRGRRPPAPAARGWASSTRVFHSPQVGTATGPPGGGRSAVDAAVTFRRLGHVPMVGTGCANRGDRPWTRGDAGRSLPSGPWSVWSALANRKRTLRRPGGAGPSSTRRSPPAPAWSASRPVRPSGAGTALLGGQRSGRCIRTRPDRRAGTTRTRPTGDRPDDAGLPGLGSGGHRLTADGSGAERRGRPVLDLVGGAPDLRCGRPTPGAGGRRAPLGRRTAMLGRPSPLEADLADDGVSRVPRDRGRLRPRPTLLGSLTLEAIDTGGRWIVGDQRGHQRRGDGRRPPIWSCSSTDDCRISVVSGPRANDDYCRSLLDAVDTE